MKRSNMLLIAAVLITLVCLTTYNYKLKATYLTKEYKNAYRGMTFKPLKDVQKLIINSANLLDIEVKQSNKEGVWIQNKWENNLKLSLHNNELTIDLKSDSGRSELASANGNKIIILTKDLNSITTTEAPHAKNPASASLYGNLEVGNYQTDHLDLSISPLVTVKLNTMKINTLNATVGTKTGEAGQLILTADNQIQTARFDVPGNGNLQLNDPKIIKTSYNLSERARVNLDGKVLQQFKSGN